jgi:hypothetical protein
MAIESAPMTLTQVESIARVELKTDVEMAQGDWRLTAVFETYYKNEAGEIIGDVNLGSSVVSRSFAQIAAQTVEVNGETYSGAEIAAVVKAFIYMLKEQQS